MIEIKNYNDGHIIEQLNYFQVITSFLTSSSHYPQEDKHFNKFI